MPVYGYSLDEVRACWLRAAQSLGCVAVVPEEGLRQDVIIPHLEMTAVIDDHKVLAIGGYQIQDTLATDVACRAPSPFGFRLSIHRGHVYPIGRALGIQDIVVGDAAFDDRFIIKSDSESLARLWLDARTRAAMLGADDYEFRLTDDLATAHYFGFDTVPAVLESAMRATAGLTARGRRIAGELQALATTLGGRLQIVDGEWRPDGQTAIEVDVRGTKCVVSWDLLGRRRELVTRIVSPGAGAPTPSRRAEELQEIARPDAFTSGDEIEVRFGGLCTDAARLGAGLDLCEVTAAARRPASTGGPYR